jgi:DNA-binding MarR family transcriptional regulator
VKLKLVKELLLDEDVVEILLKIYTNSKQVSKLAKEMDMGETTFYQKIKPLKEYGLVKTVPDINPETNRPITVYKLTEKGLEILSKLEEIEKLLEEEEEKARKRKITKKPAILAEEKDFD